MALLAGIILTLFGLGWLGVMGAMYVVGALTTPDVALPWYMLALWFGPGVITLPLGIILVIIGLVTRKRKKEVVADLLKDGVDAKALVTFVDRNFYVLVNETPIYSIVEFEFTDANGNLHTGRKDNVDSELVIRNKIEVGTEVAIKYMPTDPNINGLMLTDPRTTRLG